MLWSLLLYTPYLIFLAWTLLHVLVIVRGDTRAQTIDFLARLARALPQRVAAAVVSLLWLKLPLTRRADEAAAKPHGLMHVVLQFGCNYIYGVKSYVLRLPPPPVKDLTLRCRRALAPRDGADPTFELDITWALDGCNVPSELDVSEGFLDLFDVVCLCSDAAPDDSSIASLEPRVAGSPPEGCSSQAIEAEEPQCRIRAQEAGTYIVWVCAVRVLSDGTKVRGPWSSKLVVSFPQPRLLFALGGPFQEQHASMYTSVLEALSKEIAPSDELQGVHWSIAAQLLDSQSLKERAASALAQLFYEKRADVLADEVAECPELVARVVREGGDKDSPAAVHCMQCISAWTRHARLCEMIAEEGGYHSLWLFCDSHAEALEGLIRLFERHRDDIHPDDSRRIMMSLCHLAQFGSPEARKAIQGNPTIRRFTRYPYLLEQQRQQQQQPDP